MTFGPPRQTVEKRTSLDSVSRDSLSLHRAAPLRYQRRPKTRTAACAAQICRPRNAPVARMISRNIASASLREKA